MKRQFVIDSVVLCGVLAVTVLAALQIPRITVDGSTDAFIPRDHPVYAINTDIDEQFGSLDALLIAVDVRFGTVLEPDVLAIVRDLSEHFRVHAEVDSVTSLTTVEYMKGTGEGIDVLPLVSSSGDGASDRAETRRRLADWPEPYLGSIVSRDLKTTAIIIQPIPGIDEARLTGLYNEMRQLADEYATANIRMLLGGSRVYEEEIARSVSADIGFLVPAAAFLVILVLWLSFRRLLGVVLPIVGIVVAAVWVMGIIGAAGITITMATLLVPVLLFVVGSAYGIHVVQHFIHDVSLETGRLSFDAVSAVLTRCVRTIRVPVILAGVTTAAGFVAQLSSPLGPFRVFGILSAVGIGASLLTSLVLIPILIRFHYRHGLDVDKFRRSRGSAAGSFFLWAENTVQRRRGITAVVALALVVATAIAVPRITVGTNMADFFSPSSRVVADSKLINANLGGTGIVSVVITAPDRGGILSPEFLSNVDYFARYLAETEPHVTGVQTVVPSIRRMNALLNYQMDAQPALEEVSFDFFAETIPDAGAPTGGDGGPASGDGVADSAVLSPDASPGVGRDLLSVDELAELLQDARLEAGPGAGGEAIIGAILEEVNYHGAAFDEVPREPAKYGLETDSDLKDLLSQYLLLYSGNLSMFLDDAVEPTRTMLTVQLDNEDREVLLPVRHEISSFWDHYLPEGWQIEIGGPSTLSLAISELVIRSQYLSLTGALIIVWLIVAILFRSPLAGLFAVIPVGFALAGIFVTMSLLGFSLDIVTSLLAALAIGIGVDYGIHYISAYRRAVQEGRRNPVRAVYRTTGSAILFNAVSVSCGFLALLISRFVPIRQLGVLFAVSMILAGGASLIVLPMVLQRFTPRFLTRGGPAPGAPGVIHRDREGEENETDSLAVVRAAGVSHRSAADGNGGNGNGDHGEGDRRPDRVDFRDGD